MKITAHERRVRNGALYESKSILLLMINVKNKNVVQKTSYVVEEGLEVL